MSLEAGAFTRLKAAAMRCCRCSTAAGSGGRRRQAAAAAHLPLPACGRPARGGRRSRCRGWSSAIAGPQAACRGTGAALACHGRCRRAPGASCPHAWHPGASSSPPRRAAPGPLFFSPPSRLAGGFLSSAMADGRWEWCDEQADNPPGRPGPASRLASPPQQARRDRRRAAQTRCPLWPLSAPQNLSICYMQRPSTVCYRWSCSLGSVAMPRFICATIASTAWCRLALMGLPSIVFHLSGWKGYRNGFTAAVHQLP